MLVVGKGGLPPLRLPRANKNSGGKPPFPTCEPVNVQGWYYCGLEGALSTTQSFALAVSVHRPITLTSSCTAAAER